MLWVSDDDFRKFMDLVQPGIDFWEEFQNKRLVLLSEASK